MKAIMGMKMRRGTRERLPRERGGIAALSLLLIVNVGSSGSAQALQVLQASDHAELAAEISATQVSRIALDGDRIARVIQSPGGFTVEHDPVRGDLYLYPESPAVFGPSPGGLPAQAGAPAPVTLYVGTERGFTYRLTLSPASRGSAQILIRNAAIAAGSRGGTSAVWADHRGELVSLILAVARREPVPGHVTVPAGEAIGTPEQSSVVQLWRGPRFSARVLNVPVEGIQDAQQLARLSGANIVAAWLSAPGRGPDGERVAVLVEHNQVAGAVR